MSDESKAERLKTAISFLACVAIVVGFPWWGPIVAQMLQPGVVVVMEIAK